MRRVFFSSAKNVNDEDKIDLIDVKEPSKKNITVMIDFDFLDRKVIIDYYNLYDVCHKFGGF